jgi:hypothetical protein
MIAGTVFWVALLTVLVNISPAGREVRVWPWVILLAILDAIRFRNRK